MRHCKSCSRDLALNRFSRDRQRNDGIAFYCKECQSRSHAERRRRWAEENNIPEMMTCTICKVEKGNGEFSNDKSRPKGIRAECKPCRSAHRNRSYYSSHEGWARVILDLARRRARVKSIPFDLTPEDIRVPEVCPVLGIPLAIGIGGRHDGSPTVDRIDSSKGYTRDNVLVISWRANRIKSDATVQELRALANFYGSLTP